MHMSYWFPQLQAVKRLNSFYLGGVLWSICKYDVIFVRDVKGNYPGVID